MFEPRISAERIEKLPCSKNLCISSYFFDMEGHAKTCVERYCELANKTTQQLYKVSTPCIDDHHFREEALKSAGELSKVSSQTVLKCLYLTRIGRLDIPQGLPRVSRTLPKELDPLVGSKIVIIIIIFAFFPKNCRVLGVHKERKEEEGKGEGGRGEEDEREGHLFLTFRMVIGRAFLGSDPW